MRLGDIRNGFGLGSSGCSRMCRQLRTQPREYKYCLGERPGDASAASQSNIYCKSIIIPRQFQAVSLEQYGILISQPPKTLGFQPGGWQSKRSGRARHRGPRGHPRACCRDAPSKQGAGRDSHCCSYLELTSVRFSLDHQENARL